MQTVREVRTKIRSITDTKQVTNAMRVIAMTRLRRVEKKMLSARPFANKMGEMLGDLVAFLSSKDGAHILNPLLKKGHGPKAGIVVVAADRGLCGAFNGNVIKKTEELIAENSAKGIGTDLYVVGKKGRNYFRKVGHFPSGEYLNILDTLSYKDASAIGDTLIDTYLEHGFSEIVMVYHEFRSIIRQNLVVKRLLPVGDIVPSGETRSSAGRKTDFLYEPEKDRLIDALLHRFIKSQIFRALLESYTSELAARTVAMDNATKNAQDIISTLGLQVNKSRQALITRELTELTSCSEALFNG